MGLPRLPLSLVALAACLTLAACGTPRPPVPAPTEPIDPSRFPHLLHRAEACESCHPQDARPGRGHAPCDDGRCHRDAFLRAPGPLCRACHLEVTLSEGGLRAPLQPFPRAGSWRVLPSTFSHARHLDAERIEGAVGFHLACSDCHAVGDDGAPRHPGHAACARCHAEEVALRDAPQMGQCQRCHAEGASRPRRRVRLIRGDLRFGHREHRLDRAGAPISCASCHRGTATSETYEAHPPPAVESCVPCHDDTARVPSEQRMRACETCHAQRRGSLTAIAPRDHLPGTEQPLDHTLAFRTDHGDAAFRDPSRCAGCHTAMSGSPRDACDECHRVTPPADHRLAWRELEHGVEAAATPERCALCHTADTCVACHRERPRSHAPLSEFRFHHGALARVNLRSCMTCHDRARDCMGAGCHQDAPAGAR
ncbi:MAG: cytochrome c3 family protein [Kofleriaceae bacterium]